MGTLKLLSSEFDEIDFKLIAIHSSIEGFRVAFFLNKMLQINLKRALHKLHVLHKKGGSNFEIFDYNDPKKDIKWALIENKNTISSAQNTDQNNLFFETSTSFLLPVFLVSEYKKVDYFLRIECESNAILIDTIIAEIKKIQWITTVYKVNTNKIKTKNNLIF
jgi:hypothetical protein